MDGLYDCRNPPDATDTAQVNEPINRAQQVILGDIFFQREFVKQRRLCFLLQSHHRQIPQLLRPGFTGDCKARISSCNVVCFQVLIVCVLCFLRCYVS